MWNIQASSNVYTSPISGISTLHITILSPNLSFFNRFNVVAPAAPLRNPNIGRWWFFNLNALVNINAGQDKPSQSMHWPSGRLRRPSGTPAHLLVFTSWSNQILVNNSTWQFRSTILNSNNSCKFELFSSNPIDCDPSCLSFLPNQSSIGHPVFHNYHPTTSKTSTVFNVRVFYINLLTYW